MTEERIAVFSEKLCKLIPLVSPEQGRLIGYLIRQELDREYRRGYVTGLRETKNVDQRRSD
ncbi:MAG: hypothetical protein ACREBR_04810 [bacterium]